MATFNIGSTLIQANTERVSPGQTVPSALQALRIALVDTNNQWGSVLDNTRHVKVWGIQLSRDGGSTWVWWLFSGDPATSPTPVDGEPAPRAANPDIWIPFGFRDKQGNMPWISVEYSEIKETTGARVRLAILTDAQVRLGAQITTG